MTNNTTIKRLFIPICGALLCLPGTVFASIFQGETLDAVANAMSWVVLVVVPVVVIAVFWLVHILPEKIAEGRHHPQAKAIQTLCLLSLFFGGLLWPLAWLWAYTKPVLYKMAYGTDRVEHGKEAESDVLEQESSAPTYATADHQQATSVHGVSAQETNELERLRKRVAELEMQYVIPSDSKAE